MPAQNLRTHRIFDNRNSRYRLSIKYCLTLILSLFLTTLLTGCLSEHPNNQSTDVSTSKSNQHDEVGFEFSDFTLKRFTPSGTLDYVLSGIKLTHYPAKQSYQFESPRALSSSKLWSLSADSAKSMQSLETIYWIGNVHVVNEQNTDQKISAIEITQNTRLHQIQSDHPVTYTSNLGSLKANGFNANTETGLLNLKGDIQSHYAN